MKYYKVTYNDVILKREIKEKMERKLLNNTWNILNIDTPIIFIPSLF